MPFKLSINRHSYKIGTKFNGLSVAGPHFRMNRVSFAVFLCKCGNYTVARVDKVKKGATKSCGCWRVEIALKMGKGNTRHGMNGTNLYTVWHNFRSRCNNPNDDSYPHYGGRGITYAKEWEVFEVFAAWALTNGYQQGLQIDREKVDGDYGPDNCRFVTARKNSNNKRNTIYITAFGETKPLAEWPDDPRCVVKRHVIWCRLKTGKWTNESAITTPVIPRGAGRYKSSYQ